MPPGADAVAQARALLGQLRTLSAQHEQVLSSYERQLEAMVAAGPSKLTAKAPIKRPLSEPEGPEQKKQRIVLEQQQRRNSLWHECYKVLDRCRRNQKAEAFKKPVDPIRMKIPDYPLVIKNPMDLQTVGEKLKMKAYKDPGEFAVDMRQIWENAQVYNGRNHPVGANALAMSEFFEKAWAPLQIEKQWAIQLQQEELAREALQGNLDGLPSLDLPKQLKDKREMLGHYIAARDYNEGMPPGALGPCEPGRAMTFEEKRKLSAHLANLPSERLQRVTEIIAEGMQVPDDEGEYEVDIDGLTDAVLWQLKEYVDSVLAPPANAPTKGGAATKGPSVVGAAGKAPAPEKRAPPGVAAAAAKAAAQPPPPAAAAPTPSPPKPMPTASQLAMPAPPALGAAAAQQQQQQVAAQQQQQQQQRDTAGSPVSQADSAHDVQDSNAPGRPNNSMAYIPGDGTVAQSGIHKPTSAFVKAGKAEVNTEGLNQAAWATAGATPTTPAAAAPAAKEVPKPQEAPSVPPAPSPKPDADAAAAAAVPAAGVNGGEAAAAPAAAALKEEPAAAAAPAVQAAEGGAGGPPAAAAAAGGPAPMEEDDLWDEFTAKAAKQEAELEQQKAEEQRRKQQEEEQQRAREEAERRKEAEREAAIEAEKAAARDELQGAAAGKAQLGEDGALASEVQQLAAGHGGSDALGLGLAGAKEEEEEDEDMGLEG